MNLTLKRALRNGLTLALLVCLAGSVIACGNGGDDQAPEPDLDATIVAAAVKTILDSRATTEAEQPPTATPVATPKPNPTPTAVPMVASTQASTQPGVQVPMAVIPRALNGSRRWLPKTPMRSWLTCQIQRECACRTTSHLTEW